MATDEKDRSFFQVLDDRFRVRFLGDYYERAGVSEMNGNYIGMMEQVHTVSIFCDCFSMFGSVMSGPVRLFCILSCLPPFCGCFAMFGPVRSGPVLLHLVLSSSFVFRLVSFCFPWSYFLSSVYIRALSKIEGCDSKVFL